MMAATRARRSARADARSSADADHTARVSDAITVCMCDGMRTCVCVGGCMVGECVCVMCRHDVLMSTSKCARNLLRLVIRTREENDVREWMVLLKEC